MGRFLRIQLRAALEQVRRLDKLKERTGVDRSTHIRIAISRYLEEEEMRVSALKAKIAKEVAAESQKK